MIRAVLSVTFLLVAAPSVAWHAPLTMLLAPQFREIAEVTGAAAVNPRPEGIAALGDTIRVLWTEERGDTRSLFTRAFAADGSPIGEPLLVADDVEACDIASSSSDFAIVWSTGDGVFAALVPRDGTARSSAVLVAPDASIPSVASDGSTFLVAWENLGDSPTGLRGVMVRTVAADGALGTPAEITIERGPVTQPHVAWSGWRYLVVWGYVSGMYGETAGRFVSAAGVPLGTSTLTVAASLKYQPAPSDVGSDGEESVVAIGGSAVRIAGDGRLVGTEGAWYDQRGHLRIAWTGERFAAGFAVREMFAEGIAGIAAIGPRTIISVGAKRVAISPDQDGTPWRVVLSKATITDRRRLAMR